MRARLVLAAATVMLAVAGCASPASDAPVTTSSLPTAAAPTASSSQEDPSGPDDDGASDPTESASDVQASGPGAYIPLADYEANKSEYDATDVVLFFNASWCSTCREARENIEADLAGIPSGLTIVVVDFDAATDLRQRYGVTLQHTFVQVGPDGAELAKWSGSVTAGEIAQNTV